MTGGAALAETDAPSSSRHSRAPTAHADDRAPGTAALFITTHGAVGAMDQAGHQVPPPMADVEESNSVPFTVPPAPAPAAPAASIGGGNEGTADATTAAAATAAAASEEDMLPPWFVCGAGHSGTTLLLRTLGRVPGCHAVLEETNWAIATDRGTCAAKLERLQQQAQAAGARRLVEKSPAHVERIGTMLELRPDCTVLVCLRDGRDVAASRRARAGGDVVPGIRRWLSAVRAAARHAADHRVVVVWYEDLIANPRAVLDVLGDRLGVEIPTSALVEGTPARAPAVAYNNANCPDHRPVDVGSREGHAALRSWQLNQPLFDGRGRWETELSPNEIAGVYRLAGKELVELGYAGGGSG